MTKFERLRPPSILDPTSLAYKDWFHLNLFDHTSGCVGLINVSLHGAPTDRRARAVATALFHEPSLGWRGNVEIAGLEEATVSADGVLLPQISITTDPPRHVLHASARLPDEGVALRMTATSTTAPLRIGPAQPFGTGWIAWFVMPRLQLQGQLALADHTFNLAGWAAYHDHNWGRWFWGDDIGWEWGAFAATSSGPLFVLTRLADRRHQKCQPAQLIIVQDGHRRTFGPGSVTVQFDGRAEVSLRRLPGALAALHGDRAQPALPARLVVTAISGLDWVRLSFSVCAAAQLIEGEPMRPGYAFIHELVGRFEATGYVRDEEVTAHGLGVLEFVM